MRETTKRPSMPSLAPLPVAFFLAFVLATPALACLWDYDTLRDERRGLPGIAEVLAGRWERHSRDFYVARIDWMKARLAAHPSDLDAMDNLAVAYEKTDDRDSAIDVMLRKEKLKPGLYTTVANLGTFYLHKGDLDHGIVEIERALKINPNAHFGREEYQLRLAQYLQKIKREKGPPPLEDFLGISLFEQSGDAPPEPSPNLAKGGPGMLAYYKVKPNAFDGIVGIIRFGTGRSPDLFYALGNLLALRGDKNLAYRAYDRAIEFGHPRASEITQLRDALLQYIPEDVNQTKMQIAEERADADEWVKAFQQYESDLLKSGKDVENEANYAAFYAARGAAQKPEPFALSDWLPRSPIQRAGLFLLVLLVAAIAALIVFWWGFGRWRRRRRRLRQSGALIQDPAPRASQGKG